MIPLTYSILFDTCHLLMAVKKNSKTVLWIINLKIRISISQESKNSNPPDPCVVQSNRVGHRVQTSKWYGTDSKGSLQVSRILIDYNQMEGILKGDGTLYL